MCPVLLIIHEMKLYNRGKLFNIFNALIN